MDGRGGGLGGGLGGGATGADAVAARAFAVDTVELEDGSGRLARAAEDLAAAEEGLERLPVAAVATGADAVLDAVADLGRQWRALLDGVGGQARVLQQELALAAAGYARAEEQAAAAADQGLLPLPGFRLPPRAEHPSQDRAPAPVLGPPAP